MDLELIKKEIDGVLDTYKDEWMNFVFDDKPKLALAFKARQVYQAMYTLAVINTTKQDIKNPIVTSIQEGWDLTFTWHYKNAYLKLMVPWEGTGSIVSKSGGEIWCTNYVRPDGQEIADAREWLESQAEKEVG